MKWHSDYFKSCMAWQHFTNYYQDKNSLWHVVSIFPSLTKIWVYGRSRSDLVRHGGEPPFVLVVTEQRVQQLERTLPRLKFLLLRFLVWNKWQTHTLFTISIIRTFPLHLSLNHCHLIPHFFCFCFLFSFRNEITWNCCLLWLRKELHE